MGACCRSLSAINDSAYFRKFEHQTVRLCGKQDSKIWQIGFTASSSTVKVAYEIREYAAVIEIIQLAAKRGNPLG